MMDRTIGLARKGALALVSVYLCLEPARAQSISDKRDFSNVSVDDIRFVRLDSQLNRIIGTRADGTKVAIALASSVKVFGFSGRLQDIRPGDDVGIRSTTNDVGVVVATDVDVNVSAFDALVTSKSERGFDFIRLDYRTGVPLRGRKYVGRAIVLAKAAIDDGHGHVMQSEKSVSAIATGDKIQLYGFERPDSPYIAVFRVEIWGHE